jgi:hypothetical protein
VSASTTFGRVTSQPSISVGGPLGGESLTGKIGGGGCMLRLTNQSGNIDILE